MKCTVDGCTAIGKKKVGLCLKHYMRHWRYGTTDLLRSKKPRLETPEGYQHIYEPTHPLRHRNGYVAEHRAVLFAAIGPDPMRCELCGIGLTWKTCKVDHIDNNPRNNERSNLRPTCNACNTRRGQRAPVEWDHTHKLEFDGQVRTHNEWSRDPRVAISHNQITARKKAGMSDYDALFAPKKTHNGNPPAPPARKTRHKYERSNSIPITIGDRTMTPAEWAREPGVNVTRGAICNRLRAGWATEEAVFAKSRLRSQKEIT